MHLALLISTVQQREKQNYSLSRFHGQLNGFYIPFKDENDWVAPNTSSHISSPGARFLKVSITFQARKPVLCLPCLYFRSKFQKF